MPGSCNGRLCKLCRRAIPVDLMHGDHIHLWSLGGRTSLDNLQALCESCNSARAPSRRMSSLSVSIRRRCARVRRVTAMAA
ncbi:HNH endonuclease [Mycobacterium sp. GA-2829]|uniref:HNH endonuclease n=1 Tax=Mycobacterium sp. GA-2829 TaxID=1772283 RepID=UPI00350FE4D1